MTAHNAPTDKRTDAALTADDVALEFVTCGVEGCPRTTEEGWSEACGLWKLGLPTDPDRCASTIWVDRWFELHGERTDA